MPLSCHLKGTIATIAPPSTICRRRYTNSHWLIDWLIDLMWPLMLSYRGYTCLRNLYRVAWLVGCVRIELHSIWCTFPISGTSFLIMCHPYKCSSSCCNFVILVALEILFGWLIDHGLIDFLLDLLLDVFCTRQDIDGKLCFCSGEEVVIPRQKKRYFVMISNSHYCDTFM